MLDAPPDLLGEERPRVLNRPPRASTDLGRDAVALVRRAGLRLNPWQEFVLAESLAATETGLHAAPDVGLVVSRQNGKGEIIVARQIVGMFLLDEPLQVYTSHLFTTTKEMHRRLKACVNGYPPFARRLHSVTNGGNDVKVELKSGERVNFLARSASSGRGFSVDGTLYLDEAMNLTDAEQEALLPTTTAAGNPQVWYVGSAGIGEPSQVFARVRRDGLTGTDARLLWCEWSVPEDANPADESLWGLANPGLGLGQVTMRSLRGYRSKMTAEGFAREYLGVGDWPAEGGYAVTIPVDAWAGCLDPGSRFGPGPTALGVYITGDRATAYVAAVGSREDGLCHVEIVEECPPSRAVAAVKALVEKRRAPVVIDPGSHANSLIQPLDDAGVVVEQVTLQKLTAACGSLYDAVMEGHLRHRGQAQLDSAVLSATTRTTSRDAWAWKGESTSPLVAVTLALHGYLAQIGADYDPLQSVL